jgi:hypothetical protein
VKRHTWSGAAVFLAAASLMGGLLGYLAAVVSS